MPSLEDIAAKVRAQLDRLDAAREQALPAARKVIRQSADTIRAIHRGELEQARQALDETNALVRATRSSLAGLPEIASARFVQDAEKEHAEAQVTYAVITGQELPDPEELGVDYAAFLNGMAEAIGEMRRHIVDSIRLGQLDRSEALLEAMNDIYYTLVTFDYPDALSQGLRRRTDGVRSLIEATRADLTRALRQHQLEHAMERLERRLGSGSPPASSGVEGDAE
ncbi:MAG: haloacid dehalogenase [Armatimonadota bacterium]